MASRALDAVWMEKCASSVFLRAARLAGSAAIRRRGLDDTGFSVLAAVSPRAELVVSKAAYSGSRKSLMTLVA
jgi:hypothetical protein